MATMKRDQGASVVEFAIILPLFLLLIGGMVDLGRAFYTEVMLTNAAREGARAAMYGNPPDGPTGRGTVAARSIVGASVSGTPCPPGATDGSATVKVSAPFTWNILGPAMNIVTLGSGDALPTTLTGEATMQCGG